jgi:hypothetical protein
MTIDYDEFRRTTWEERVAIFNALSSEKKAELVRSQIAGWLERHRGELSPPQIEFLEEAARWPSADMYEARKPDAVVARAKDMEKRARALLSREQIVDSLTMQWGMT